MADVSFYIHDSQGTVIGRFSSPLDEAERARVDGHLQVQSYQKLSAELRESSRVLLKFKVHRKILFKSDERKDNHDRGVRRTREFLSDLYKKGLCVFMSNSMVLMLSQETVDWPTFPNDPSIELRTSFPAQPSPTTITPTTDINTIQPVAPVGEQPAAAGSFMDDSTYRRLRDECHLWPFSAVAELVHNSSDAGATEVRLSIERFGPNKDRNFVVIDDGSGMTNREMGQLFKYGKDYGDLSYSQERCGRNGVGFKQGVLRLGETAVVISVSKGEEAPMNQRCVPTASFGILSIDAYRKSLRKNTRERVVVEYATLNLMTMTADERYNSPAKFSEVLNTIQTLVPYFTRDFLVTYAARFLDFPKGSAWDFSGVRSSTSIFVSQLRTITRLGRRGEDELILDTDKHDLLYKNGDGSNFRLPKRPKTCVGEAVLSPTMDYSLRSFCEMMFLIPKMKIHLQGQLVQPRSLLSSMVDTIDYFVNLDEIVDEEIRDIAANSEGRSPYLIRVHVGHDSWHRQLHLSGIMTYAENCLIDSYARDTYSPLVPLEESGILAIVSFSGSTDKRLFNPHSTKVGFPENNVAYGHVIKMAAEYIAQRIANIPVNAPPLGARHGNSNWIQCGVCNKWRRVPEEYRARYDHQHWNCAFHDSPVPFLPNNRNKCDFPEEDWGEETLSGYHGPGSSTSGLQRQNSRLQHQANGLQRQMSDIIPDRYKVLPSNINFDSSMRVGEGSSAKVYQGVRCMWKVFKKGRYEQWKREKDILLAMADQEEHDNICRLAGVCQDHPLAIGLRPVLSGSRSLATYIGGTDEHTLKNSERLAVVQQVGDALRFLHERQIFHNDVQPSNIVRGSAGEVFLVDFGQACCRNVSTTATAPRASTTSFGYDPPEVVLDPPPRPIDGKRDVFGFGVTLVEVFTGRRMWESSTTKNIDEHRDSLEMLRGYGDLAQKDKRDLETSLPVLWQLYTLQGMVPLGNLCVNCVNGDSAARFSMAKVVESLQNFANKVEFHWRHGKSIVYHTIEPGDDLILSGNDEERAIQQLGRLPRSKGATPVQNPIEDHIRNGSRFDYRSPYISCSLNFSYCVFYAQKQNNMFSEYGLAPILKIDLSKLSPKDCRDHVIDRTRHAVRPSKNVISRNFSCDAEEIILDMPIPAAAIRRVYNLDHRILPGESSFHHKARVGVLKDCNKLNSSANERGDPFATWEKKYNDKFIRMVGDKGGDPDSVRDKARCRDLEAMRRFLGKYCNRKKRTPSRGVRVGGANGVSAEEQSVLSSRTRVVGMSGGNTKGACAERQQPGQIGTGLPNKKTKKAK